MVAAYNPAQKRKNSMTRMPRSTPRMRRFLFRGVFSCAMTPVRAEGFAAFFPALILREDIRGVIGRVGWNKKLNIGLMIFILTTQQIIL
jgi:hypothetical protein